MGSRYCGGTSNPLPAKWRSSQQGSQPVVQWPPVDAHSLSNNKEDVVEKHEHVKRETESFLAIEKGNTNRRTLPVIFLFSNRGSGGVLAKKFFLASVGFSQVNAYVRKRTRN